MTRPGGHGLVRLWAWIPVNLKFLYVRALAVLIRFPRRIDPLIETVGLCLGIGAMALKIRQWKGITAFARENGIDTRGIRFIARQFIQLKRDTVWTELFYEAHARVRPRFGIDNLPLIQETARGGKGGIFLAAHCGPLVYRPLLNELGLGVRQVIGAGTKQILEDQDRLGIPFLKSGRIPAFVRSKDNFLAGQSEKVVLRAVRNGAWMLMFLDFPRREPGGCDAEFFGRPFVFHDFPFKVAIRYHLPVLFGCFRRDPGSGYRLCVEPCGPIGTPGEGVRRYASFVEGHVREDPSMWIQLPKFIGWTRGNRSRRA